MLQLVSDKTQTLKEFTENNYAQASFFWNALLKNKDVKVNDVRVNKDVLLQSGDVVSYYLTKKQEEKPAFYTVFEDENVLVIDKESGVNSEAVFAALSREKECYFIHRLDRNTRGLMVFALNERTATALLQAFKEKRVDKIYHALCFGSFKRDGEILQGYLRKDERNALVKVFDKPTAGVEKIITEYKVLARNDETTKVAVVLHTGKTHQIRAHLAHIGHPLVGDMKYGISERNRALKTARQCLVAKSLHFDMQGEWTYLNDKTFISRFEAEALS